MFLGSVNPFPWFPFIHQPRILFVIQWLSIVSVNSMLTLLKEGMSVFEAYFAVSYYCLINSPHFRETMPASAGMSKTLVVLKILVLFFFLGGQHFDLFSLHSLKVKHSSLGSQQAQALQNGCVLDFVCCDIWICLPRKWSSVFFIKNKVTQCSFSCRRDQVYSRAGAAYARTTTSPCRGMQVYKQLHKTFARSEG